MLNNLVSSGNFWLQALLSLFSSFLICFFCIKKFLSYGQKKELFQPIRKDGPESHLINKKRTPTMGGIFIISGVITTNLLFGNLSNPYFIICLLITFVFAIIGLTDDILKVIYKNPKGFRGSYKLLIQFAIISLCYIWIRQIDEVHNSANIYLPINGGSFLNLGFSLYLILICFVIVGSANAFNLTDGLDGLASMPAIITFISLAVIIFIVGSPELAAKYNVIEIKNSQSLMFFCISQIGAISAFLIFNYKPAKIFMGDVGSLGIGASMGILAVLIKQEIIFFVISLLFVVEAISVILQVCSFKLRKKRIFLMAPIHHHFEKLGFSEIKVVKIFWLASFLSASLGLIIFFA
jgi:phospho-N-acetylmuramoyl-pentapeptide-transferase